MTEPNIFSPRGMELSEQWHKEKLLFMYDHGVYGSDELPKEGLHKFYAEFMDAHTSKERAQCSAEINELFPTAEEFWRWYDSPHRVRNQLRMEAKK